MNKKITLLMIAVVTGLIYLGSSCCDCPPRPFQPSINGNYTGTYQYVEINAVDTIVDTSQLIDFRFRDGEFLMLLDSTILESSRVFCDVSGEYILGRGVDMKITDSNYSDRICEATWGPDGFFGLNQPADTMTLLRDFTDSTGIRIIQKLRLVME